MAHKPVKRGALVRDSQLHDHAEDTSQDSHEKRDRVRQPSKVTGPGSRKHEPKPASKEKQLLAKGKHRHRPEKVKHEESQSHDNPGFLDDYGSIAATDGSLGPKTDSDLHQSEGHDKAETKPYPDGPGYDGHVSERQHKHHDSVAKDPNTDHSTSYHEHNKDSRHSASGSPQTIVIELETGVVPTLAVTSTNQGQGLDTISERIDNDSYLVQTIPGDAGVSLNQSPTPSPQQQACVDNVNVVPLNNKSRTGLSWLTRPHSRSISSVSSMFSRTEVADLAPEPDAQAFQRSYSMRVPSARDKDKPKSRALLRELSFSDADARTVRNYGSLRGGLFVSRRQPVEQAALQEDSGEDMNVDMGPELKSQLRDLMQELLSRGKVRQAALFAQEGCDMLVSVPPWDLPHRDEIGLVKTVTSTADTISKLAVGYENYTFFKHGPDKVMGRCGDRVLVAHKTKLCVVVGVADDNTPGSCMYEVSELVATMVNKGW